MAGRILTVFFFSYFQRCSELHGCRHVWQIHQHQSFNQSSQRRPQRKLSRQWHYEMWPFRQSAAHLRRLSQYFRRIPYSNFQLSIWVIELWQVDKKRTIISTKYQVPSYKKKWSVWRCIWWKASFGEWRYRAYLNKKTNKLFGKMIVYNSFLWAML